MRFIQELSVESTSLLKRLYKQSQHSQVRQRAHCILLSSEGFTIPKLMKILDVSRETIYNWMNDWEKRRFAGLYDRPGRGRKPTFSPEQQKQIRQWAKQNPKNLRLVLQRIQDEWGISTSLDTVQRVLKSFLMSWKRMRRGLAGQPDPVEYESKTKELEVLKEQDDHGEIDLRYMDEAGFCLVPCIPYAWQERGETLEILSQNSQRINVLGFMNRSNELEPYIFTGSITSAVVIACIDEFCNTCQKKTVIVMDQAPIHNSEAFQDKVEEWATKNVTIFQLPTYSPELNLIEILWRFMKYEWIELKAYESWKSMNEYLDKVLKGFGKEYVINFA